MSSIEKDTKTTTSELTTITDILAPIPYPGVGLYPHFIAQKTETLIVKCKALHWDWTVTLADGTTLLLVETALMSRSGRRSVLYANRRRLFDVRREYFSWRGTYYGEGENEVQLWQMINRFT